MKASWILSSVLVFGAVASAQRPPAIVSTPGGSMPTVHIAPPAAVKSGSQFVAWAAQDVRCGKTPVAFVRSPAPGSAMAWIDATSGMTSIGYTFTIDETGRTLDVTRTSKGYAPAAADLTPALVVAQFAPGAARQGCSLTFVPTASPVSEALAKAVMGYIMFPEQRPTSAMYARTRPAGSTCFDPTPQILNRAFPAFDGIPKRAGELGWSMIGFDIDARGKPIHLKREAGTGNAALDTASVAAVAESRFSPGARMGCQYPYWIAAATLPPPPMPEEATFRTSGATCPAEADWAVQPPLTYPPSFARRWIEGWAIIGYDVAPWGATGNLRVLAAQPAADFGEQAMQMLIGAKRVPSTTGYVGCVDRVVFRMPRPGEKSRRPESRDDAPQPF